MIEYSNEARLKRPLKLLREIQQGFKNGYYFAFRLFWKDIKGQTNGLRLGHFWNFGEPLIYALIFLVIRDGSVFFEEGIELPLTLFVLMGLMTYQAFVQSLVRGMNLIEEHAVLMNQVKIPSESFVLSCLMRSTFDFLFSIPVIAGLAIYYGIFDPTSFIFSYAIMYMSVIIATSLGLIVSPIVTIYPDIGKLIGLSLRPLMFLAPIFYTSDKGSVLSTINQYIPLSVFIEEARSVLVYRDIHISSILGIHITVSVLILFIAILFINLSLPILNKK